MYSRIPLTQTSVRHNIIVMLLSKDLPSIGLYTHQETATVLEGFLHVMAVLMCIQGRLKLSVNSEKHLSTASS